jgi:hypothetical protein
MTGHTRDAAGDWNSLRSMAGPAKLVLSSEFHSFREKGTVEVAAERSHTVCRRAFVRTDDLRAGQCAGSPPQLHGISQRWPEPMRFVPIPAINSCTGRGIDADLVT